MSFDLICFSFSSLVKYNPLLWKLVPKLCAIHNFFLFFNDFSCQKAANARAELNHSSSDSAVDFFSQELDKVFVVDESQILIHGWVNKWHQWPRCSTMQLLSPSLWLLLVFVMRFLKTLSSNRVKTNLFHNLVLLQHKHNLRRSHEWREYR